MADDDILEIEKLYSEKVLKRKIDYKWNIRGDERQQKNGESRNKAAEKMLKFVRGCRRHIEVWTRMRYWK